MVFDYYHSLSGRQKAVYRRSDGVAEVRLRRPERLAPLAADVRRSLATEGVRTVQRSVSALCDALCADLDVRAPVVQVLARRPRSRTEELHGLYEREEGRGARIQVWMRTSARRKVVAYRTFLRTVLHEMCHHLDFELLRLPDTYHTEGFFKRESSLVKALVPPSGRSSAARPPARRPPAPSRRAGAQKRTAGAVERRRPVQLSLFDAEE
jgi:hypothetical protein